MLQYIHIIKGVRRNDKKAQMAFYDLFYKPVFQSAYGIVGNHDDAEEIMHDTLLKAFSKHDLLHEDIAVMTRLLKRIAVNQAIDVLRKRKDFIFPIEDEYESDLIDEDDENDGEYELTIADIKNGIDCLSPVYRSILSLRLFEEMSFGDIATTLKINASTARVQYQRGILKLRTLLKQQLYAYE
ncbi:MAG: RNA polymerase sigma factor [Tannerella sp.]|jgi:RNA polymerase sigma-70 factor (ECF subfamily)|nr:RNA polymerase sigma factor [Tannerella sp.]